MQIYVDPCVGSKHIVDPLRLMLEGMHEVDLKPRKFGDVTWCVDAPDGPMDVAVELKRCDGSSRDLLDSIKSGRLIEHQIPGLLTRNRVVYLLIQGQWQPHMKYRGRSVVKDEDYGALEVYTGFRKKRGWGQSEWTKTGWKYDAVIGFLSTLEHTLGVRVWHTRDAKETLWWLRSKIKWWAKPYDKHKSAQAWAGISAMNHMPTTRKPSTVELFAAMLPGIGQTRATEVARRFKTIRAMMISKPDDWVGIRGAGATTAGKKRPGLTLESVKPIMGVFDELHLER